MRTLSITAAALCSLIAAQISQATPFERPDGAGAYEELRAGYAALFTCSAHFIMGRPLADIKQVELVDLGPALPHIEIDPVRQLVRARDGDVATAHTAIAAYRDSLGCTVLPPNWTEADVPRLPYVAMAANPDMSKVDFPQGDKVRVRSTGPQRALLQRAFDGTSFGEGTVTLATLVIKDGKLVAEQYRDGFGIHTGYRTWSTAKSVAATLIGIALRDGLIELDNSIDLPEWQYYNDPRQAITWRHLLNMSSSLNSAGASTGALYFGGQDVVSSITRSALAGEPNTIWKYANADTLLLLYALRHKLNDDLRYLRYPYDELFHKIGMFHSRYEVDHLGNFIGSSQMYTTARDLARFGLLYLQQGVWNGEQILPEGWTDLVAKRAPAMPAEATQGYGGQFWLIGDYEGVPDDAYTTAGNKGQLVTIIPSENMVVVRTGVDPNGKRWQQHEFVKAVLAAF